MEQSNDKPKNQEGLNNPKRKQPVVSQEQVLQRLKRAVAEEDLNNIEANLKYIKDTYPELEDTADVNEAKKLLETLKELRKKVELERLRQATIQQNEQKIRQTLAFITENIPELLKTNEVEDAKKQLKQLEEERDAAAAINKLHLAVKLRDEKKIKQELDDIKDNHEALRKRKDVRDAEKILKKLQADRMTVNQKMILARLHQAKIRQDVDQIGKLLEDISVNFQTLEELPEVQDAAEWLRILQKANELRQICKSRNKDDIKNALREIENDRKLKEALRFLILEAKYILEDLEKAKKKSLQLKYDLSSFNEVRRYFAPPPGVLQVMQAVFLLLGVDEDRTKTWQDVQRLWKPNGKDSLHKQIVNFNEEEVHPMIAARAREIVLGQYEEKEMTEEQRKKKEQFDEDGDYMLAENENDELRDEKSTARGLRGVKFEDQEDDVRADDSVTVTAVLTKKKGVNFRQLRQSCPVARALLVWVLDVAQKVEDREGAEVMVPARDVREQKKIFGTILPGITKMDRQYYRELAQTSVRRGNDLQKPPPQSKPNNDEKSYRYYHHINQKLPRLVEPTQQPSHTSSGWYDNPGYTRRKLHGVESYRDPYYDGPRYGQSSRYDYYDDGRMNHDGYQ